MKKTRLTCTLLLGCLSVAACSSTTERDTAFEKPTPASGKQPQLSEQDLRQEADVLYRHARKALDSGEYSSAVTDYDKLIARYPFTDYGTQAELEKIFAQYKSYQFDEALSSADRFLRDHPRHPKADYVQYIKGVINFDRDTGLLDSLPIDSSKHDVSSQQLAYNDFALLVLKYPNSRYISDARLRMIWLRNRVAQHELSIVRFYIKRGAYVAAAKRAETLIAEFPGAPATGEALKSLERCYREIGLTHEADDAAKLIAANPGVLKPVQSKPVRNSEVAAAENMAVANTGTAATATPAQETHGFFSWFTGLFSFLDTTRPENTYQITIPTNHGEGTPTSSASTPPTVDGATSSGSAAAVAPAASTASTSEKTKRHSLHITVGPEPGDEWHPIAALPSAPKAAVPMAAPPRTGGSNEPRSGLLLHYSDTLSKPAPPSSPDAAKTQPAQPASAPADNGSVPATQPAR